MTLRSDDEINGELRGSDKVSRKGVRYSFVVYNVNLKGCLTSLAEYSFSHTGGLCTSVLALDKLRIYVKESRTYRVELGREPSTS